uniref:Acetylcholinesterase n=1 Tax=Strongyloides papillosus TaxID=174720 RepID=A0A0N5CIJ6_STREA
MICIFFEQTKKTVLGETITEYLGVPYARPPTHFWRFGPPCEFNETYWNGTYYAVNLADACPQIIRKMGFSGYDDANPTEAKNETCLKFNMWVPTSNDGKNMSVIVFFHGGSWTVRTASVDKFNGSVLALKTNSIVIAANFRLGFFGFAYLINSTQIRGNMGLLDQQALLKFINKNIYKFNGNSSSVTIFGTSSGASSVAAHLFSSGSKPYFHRGIMSSGTITHFMSTVSTKIADNNTRSVAEKVNCTSKANSSITTDDQIAECLKNRTVTDLLEATKNVSAKGQMPTPFPFMPIDNDTVFFNGSLKKMYKDKSFNKDVNLMMGRTADEATFFMATGFTNNSRYNCSFYPLKPADDPANSCIMNETNFLNLVSFGSKILNFTAEENKTLIEIYNKSETTYTNKSIRILSDFIFDCELSSFALTYANATNNSVYLYEYARRSPINLWPSWTGAMHGDDLIDIFGIPFRHPEKYKNKTNEKEKKTEESKNGEESLDEEQKLSEQVMWTIGNFSKYGNTTFVWEEAKPRNLTAFIFNGTESFSSPKNKNFTPPTCIEFSKLIHNYTTRIRKEMMERMEKKKEEAKEKEKKKE